MSPAPFGAQIWKAHHVYISDQAIASFLKHTENIAGPFTFAYFDPEDGAISRVDSSATAFPHRDGAYGFHILAGWTGSEEDAAIMEWVPTFNNEMARFSTGGVYVNLLAEDEPDRIQAAYGRNYDRLVELKRKWDPDNLFRCNQNIRPS